VSVVTTDDDVEARDNWVVVDRGDGDVRGDVIRIKAASLFNSMFASMSLR
jgi:hypothetical protein